MPQSETRAGLDRQGLIRAVQDIARKHGLTTVSQTRFQREARLSCDQPKKLFGTWNRFIRAAGLEPNESRKRIDDTVLLKAVRDACAAAGGIVSVSHFNRKGRHWQSPYRKRWGSWRNVLQALREWAEREDPTFPYLHLLPRSGEKLPRSLTAWPPPERRYGAPLHFPGFLHEPVNEQGVVLLFGALAKDLGFAVESVTGGFPDCEAKRRCGDSWQRVRIEFEFQSRNFVTHRHDAAGCDLIVCWEDNWREAPLEVLSLKVAIRRIAPRAES